MFHYIKWFINFVRDALGEFRRKCVPFRRRQKNVQKASNSNDLRSDLIRVYRIFMYRFMCVYVC